MSAGFRVIVTAPPTPAQVESVHRLIEAAALYKASQFDVPAAARAEALMRAHGDLLEALRGRTGGQSAARCVAAALSVLGVPHDVVEVAS